MTRSIGALLGGLLALVAGMPAAGHAADCAEKFPIGRFALTRSDAARITMVAGFSPVYVLRKPVETTSSDASDPCELVYGFDVFELTDGAPPGALVAGCRGDFDGDGRPDYVLLLRRQSDGVKLVYAFLARGATFDAIELAPYGEPPAWSGPFCLSRPQSGIFEAPDFEGAGRGERVRVVGDLVTVGWSTYYWRPALRRFDAILTTD
jgi:hypothetical protein